LDNSIGRISVVMAAYNAEGTIRSSIESALAQTYRDIEVIVVDDCSADHTAEIVESFDDPRVILLRNYKNSGAAYSRHRGAVRAVGDWIAILDSDDLWTPDKLEKQAALVLEKGAELVFTGSGFIEADGTGIDWTLHVPETITYRELLRQNLISDSSALVRKKLFLGGESFDNRAHEDFVCWLRILRRGVTAYGIDEPLLIYRIAKKSRSGNKVSAAMMNWRTYRAVGVDLPTSCLSMSAYMINGFKKYRQLSKAPRNKVHQREKT
jgi:teichuronic acid biosynthesis glycosyltransferase TuaG